jgi:hypothetical protein
MHARSVGAAAALHGPCAVAQVFDCLLLRFSVVVCMPARLVGAAAGLRQYVCSCVDDVSQLLRVCMVCAALRAGVCLLIAALACSVRRQASCAGVCLLIAALACGCACLRAWWAQQQRCVSMCACACAAARTRVCWHACPVC